MVAEIYAYLVIDVAVASNSAITSPTFTPKDSGLFVAEPPFVAKAALAKEIVPPERDTLSAAASI